MKLFAILSLLLALVPITLKAQTERISTIDEYTLVIDAERRIKIAAGRLFEIIDTDDAKRHLTICALPSTARTEIEQASCARGIGSEHVKHQKRFQYCADLAKRIGLSNAPWSDSRFRWDVATDLNHCEVWAGILKP